MCGILGIWDSQLPSESVMRAALGKLRHRGPDDDGLLIRPPVAIGMRRLAIIDLETGKQPQFNEDGRVAVVCNGEIYNYRELRVRLRGTGHEFRSQSDTEVLAHLYEERGADLCSDLRGMYAFAIWDAPRRRLLLGRDRFGKKPLYYARTPSGGLAFASELKALMPLVAAVGGRWERDPRAISDYLSLGCVPQPRTIIRDVFAVPPGSLATFDGRELSVESYWQPRFEPKCHDDYPEILARTRQLVSDATRLRLRSDVPLGVFLSGGVDSTVVAYEAARHYGPQLQTFTVQTNDADFDESPIARRTAEYLGVRHTVLPLRIDPLPTLEQVVRCYDQPFGDPSAIPSLAIARLAREHVTVVLNGDGGDELFAGYRRYWAAAHSERFQWLPRSLAGLLGRELGKLAGRRSPGGFVARFLRGLAGPAGTRYLVWTTDRILEADKQCHWRGGERGDPTEAWIEQFDGLPSGGLDRQLALDIRINLLSALLVKMDIASMAASLEARSPLLDQELADFALRLPPGRKLRGRQLKSPLRDAYRGLIPREVIAGRKRGFEIPLANWLQTDLREIVGDLLLQGQPRVCEFLDREFVRGIVQRRVLRDRNWATLVYQLLVLEMWLRDFAQQQNDFRSRQSGVRPAA
ncbi:MAG: asparagine synthase (glutamine-hydrolyzing) [Planctomycetota bacterium]|nr:MAG: asparagine synthase (glutamine-hydrolyzing) [Planctomycetota bacterium]